MSDNLIASQTLNPELRTILVALLEVLIPADESYGVPSAGDDQVVDDFIRSMKGSTETITSFLKTIDSETNGGFTSMSPEDRLNQFESIQQSHRGAARTLGSLLLHVYYRDDRVLESLGMEGRAPFPLGNEVDRGDYTLLDPVKARGSIYRAV